MIYRLFFKVLAHFLVGLLLFTIHDFFYGNRAEVIPFVFRTLYNLTPLLVLFLHCRGMEASFRTRWRNAAQARVLDVGMLAILAGLLVASALGLGALAADLERHLLGPESDWCLWMSVPSENRTAAAVGAGIGSHLFGLAYFLLTGDRATWRYFAAAPLLPLRFYLGPLGETFSAELVFLLAVSMLNMQRARQMHEELRLRRQAQAEEAEGQQ